MQSVVETKNECSMIQVNKSRETSMQEGRICSSENIDKSLKGTILGLAQALSGPKDTKALS